MISLFVSELNFAPGSSPAADDSTAQVNSNTGVIANWGKGRGGSNLDWSTCSETWWSALASAQRALDCTAPMIALRGQQKAYLLEQESERGSELKLKMDLRLVLSVGQQGFWDQVPAPYTGGSSSGRERPLEEASAVRSRWRLEV